MPSNPALLRHTQERAQSVENRVADAITRFAGSMPFVYRWRLRQRPASLRNQPEQFGQVILTPTAWRILAEELPADPRGISGLWSALARVRERAWTLGAAPAGPLILDMDATLVEAHSDKQGAAPTCKHGDGFHPLGCWLDRGDGTGRRWP